ncbi:TRAP transporter small permease [Malonomonas rubra]|uniref:TRAP transporter small permease n=1 Tax=Malonomonas rubra TaxID=57040 RepID=UPI0026EE3277|nr:TRAP transporter small permease [Malonomonas rubra]
MIYRTINWIEETIICLLLASMTLLVFVEVVMRFGFNAGVMWAQEATLHLSAWMVLFGASYGIKVGSHIGVDALVKTMPSMTRRIISGLAVAACLFYCGLFTKGSWVYLAKMYKIGIELDDMPIPKWIAHSILLIGILLIAIRLLALLWAIITGKAEGFSMTDEAKESMHLAEEAKAAAAKEGDSA